MGGGGYVEVIPQRWPQLQRLAQAYYYFYFLSAPRGVVCVDVLGGGGGAPSSANVTSLDTCCSEQLGSFIRTLCTCAASFLEMECVRVMLHLMGGGAGGQIGVWKNTDRSEMSFVKCLL